MTPGRRRLETLGAGAGGFLVGTFGVLVVPGRAVPVPPTPPLLALALGVGLACAAALAALVLAVRRNRGGERELVRLTIERGVLPEGVARTRMRNALESRFDVLSSWRWLWPLLAGVQLLTAVSRVLDAGQTPYARVFWSIAVVFWVAVGVSLPLRARRERPVVRRLLVELDGPQEADPSRRG
ncbi:hypothetical protein GCM10025783_21070 [Amnibacterium soli]|uniref:Integral membrane protein n=1 Tax=Amnibacterium soli TaxID=1282736 RepID=A0ABP8Z795_9MICO